MTLTCAIVLGLVALRIWRAIEPASHRRIGSTDNPMYTPEEQER